MPIRLLLACAVFGGALTACSPPTEPDAVALDPTPPLEIGGSRPARVVLPPDYDVNVRYPLVVMLHGYSANALAQDAIFGLRARTAERQFVLVMPEGTKDSGGKRFWNATPQCCDFDRTGTDDVAYLTGLIDEAARTYAIDTANVALVGHSNGGYMSYRMACDKPEKIARIAVLAGAVSLASKDCPATRPVGVLHIHGTHDDTVTYQAHPTAPVDGIFPIQTLGAEAAVERWRAKNGCAPGMPAPVKADLTGLPGSETDVFTWSGCAAGAPVELWRVNEGDHLLLDVTDAFRDRVAGYLVGEQR